jgi:hypothetical protein
MRVPARPIEDLVVAGEVACLGASGHPQAGGDGALAGRQHGAHHQYQHMLPAWRGEAGAQRLQPIAQTRGNRIAPHG